MEINEVTMNLDQIFTHVGMAVTIASVLVAAFDKIAQITPSTKDDELASKLAKGLSVIVSILDKFSVHTTSDKTKQG